MLWRKLTNLILPRTLGTPKVHVWVLAFEYDFAGLVWITQNFLIDWICLLTGTQAADNLPHSAGKSSVIVV